MFQETGSNRILTPEERATLDKTEKLLREGVLPLSELEAFLARYNRTPVIHEAPSHEGKAIQATQVETNLKVEVERHKAAVMQGYAEALAEFKRKNGEVIFSKLIAEKLPGYEIGAGYNGAVITIFSPDDGPVLMVPGPRSSTNNHYIGLYFNVSSGAQNRPIVAMRSFSPASIPQRSLYNELKTDGFSVLQLIMQKGEIQF